MRVPDMLFLFGLIQLSILTNGKGYDENTERAQCTSEGQFLLHPTNRCKFIHCTHNVFLREQRGSYMEVIKDCPLGTAVPLSMYDSLHKASGVSQDHTLCSEEASMVDGNYCIVGKKAKHSIMESKEYFPRPVGGQSKRAEKLEDSDERAQNGDYNFAQHSPHKWYNILVEANLLNSMKDGTFNVQGENHEGRNTVNSGRSNSKSSSGNSDNSGEYKIYQEDYELDLSGKRFQLKTPGSYPGPPSTFHIQPFDMNRLKYEDPVKDKPSSKGNVASHVAPAYSRHSQPRTTYGHSRSTLTYQQRSNAPAGKSASRTYSKAPRYNSRRSSSDSSKGGSSYRGTSSDEQRYNPRNYPKQNPNHKAQYAPPPPPRGDYIQDRSRMPENFGSRSFKKETNLNRGVSSGYDQLKEMPGLSDVGGYQPPPGLTDTMSYPPPPGGEMSYPSPPGPDDEINYPPPPRSSSDNVNYPPPPPRSSPDNVNYPPPPPRSSDKNGYQQHHNPPPRTKKNYGPPPPRSNANMNYPPSPRKPDMNYPPPPREPDTFKYQPPQEFSNTMDYQPPPNKPPKNSASNYDSFHRGNQGSSYGNYDKTQPRSQHRGYNSYSSSTKDMNKDYSPPTQGKSFKPTLQEKPTSSVAGAKGEKEFPDMMDSQFDNSNFFTPDSTQGKSDGVDNFFDSSPYGSGTTNYEQFGKPGGDYEDSNTRPYASNSNDQYSYGSDFSEQTPPYRGTPTNYDQNTNFQSAENVESRANQNTAERRRPDTGYGPSNGRNRYDSDSFTNGGPSDSFTNGGPSDSFTNGGPSDSFTNGGPSDSFTNGRPSDSFTNGGPSDSFTNGGPSGSFTNARPSDSFTNARPSDSFTNARPMQGTSNTYERPRGKSNTKVRPDYPPSTYSYPSSPNSNNYGTSSGYGKGTNPPNYDTRKNTNSNYPSYSGSASGPNYRSQSGNHQQPGYYDFMHKKFYNSYGENQAPNPYGKNRNNPNQKRRPVQNGRKSYSNVGYPNSNSNNNNNKVPRPVATTNLQQEERFEHQQSETEWRPNNQESSPSATKPEFAPSNVDNGNNMNTNARSSTLQDALDVSPPKPLEFNSNKRGFRGQDYVGLKPRENPRRTTGNQLSQVRPSQSSPERNSQIETYTENSQSRDQNPQIDTYPQDTGGIENVESLNADGESKSYPPQNFQEPGSLGYGQNAGLTHLEVPRSKSIEEDYKELSKDPAERFSKAMAAVTQRKRLRSQTVNSEIEPEQVLDREDEGQPQYHRRPSVQKTSTNSAPQDPGPPQEYSQPERDSFSEVPESENRQLNVDANPAPQEYQPFNEEISVPEANVRGDVRDRSPPIPETIYSDAAQDEIADTEQVVPTFQQTKQSTDDKESKLENNEQPESKDSAVKSPDGQFSDAYEELRYPSWKARV